MANGRFILGKQSGGTLGLVFPDGVSNTEVMLPESGSLVSVDTTVTDNAIARYDGTTGKLQGSGVIIDDNGNVGIGTTSSPIGAGKGIELGFSGGIYGDGINYNWNTQVTQNAYPIMGGQHRYRYTQPAGAYIIDGSAHIWRTAPLGTANSPITWNNVMTLDNNGDLLVGYGNILVNSLSSETGNTIAIFGANKLNYIQLVGRDTVNSDGVLLSYMGGFLKSAISANGSFISATNSYGSTSDAKLKENVQDASPKLDKLMQVKVRTFNYIGHEDKQIGVIAQEIEQIFPSIVYETKDTKQVDVEKTREITLEDGTVTTETYVEKETVETGEVTKNVKYSVIYMMMLKAMQEQQEIINDLKARVEKLELGVK